jgi:hypothetical protein
VNEALVLVVTAAGAELIDVFGACRSIVHARVAGLVSTLPTASRARTAKVCAPASRFV